MYVDVPPNAKVFGKFVRVGLKIQAMLDGDNILGLRLLNEDFYFFESLNVPASKVFEVLTSPSVQIVEKDLPEGVKIRIFKDESCVFAVLLTDVQQLLDVLLVNKNYVEVYLHGGIREDDSYGREQSVHTSYN